MFHWLTNTKPFQGQSTTFFLIKLFLKEKHMLMYFFRERSSICSYRLEHIQRHIQSWTLTKSQYKSLLPSLQPQPDLFKEWDHLTRMTLMLLSHVKCTCWKRKRKKSAQCLCSMWKLQMIKEKPLELPRIGFKNVFLQWFMG